MSDSNNNEEEYYSYALGRKVSSNELVGKTASDSFNSDATQQINELKAKIASLEKEKEDQQSATKQSNREAIEQMIPRNLPQYRSDEDFNKEVEHRVNQINEYTTLDDLRGLYDAKMWKHAKQLAGKSASNERRQFYDFIQNPMSNVVGNNLIHRRIGRSNRITNINNARTYEPIGSTASVSAKNDSKFWYLDLFNESNYLGGS